MSHLDDEALSAAAGSVAAGVVGAGPPRSSPAVLPPSVAAHLGRCQWCAQRLAGLSRMAAAVREVDEEATGLVAAPSFDAALGPRLAALGAVEHSATPAMNTAASLKHEHEHGQVSVPGVVPAAGLAVSWRLAVAVLARQRRLLPGALLGVITLVGLVVAVVLALSVPTPAVGERLFAAAVSLVVLVGAGAVCSPRWDPRHELLMVMPVPPVAVFGCRLTLVLGTEMLTALAASLIATALGLPAGLDSLVLGWLGPALVAAASLVVVSVWRSAGLGALVGALVWVLGVAAGAADAQGSVVGLGAVLAPLSATTPWTLALAAVLLAAAMIRVSSAGRRRSA